MSPHKEEAVEVSSSASGEVPTATGASAAKAAPSETGGLEFDGPLAPLTDEAIEASKRKRRRLNETKTTTLNAAAQVVAAAKAKAGSGPSSLSASETTSSVKRLAATPITPEVEEGELR